MDSHHQLFAGLPAHPISDLLALANLLHFQVKTFWLATRGLGLLAVCLFYIADSASMMSFPPLHQWKKQERSRVLSIANLAG
jgi:hypothetical protein